MKLFLCYLAAINLIGMIPVCIDKRRARLDQWRVRERTFFILALLGGTVGVYVAMRLAHHKTLHKRFMWGLPLIFVLQIVIAILCVIYVVPHPDAVSVCSIFYTR